MKIKDKYSLKIFIYCWMAYASSYLGRLNYSACMTDIMKEMLINKTYAGAVSTGFLACYGAGQLINGVIGDRVSPKYMVFTGLAGAGIANILMGINRFPSMLIVIWCLNGIFHSMLWSPIIKCFAEWLQGESREKAALNISTTIPVGMVISYLISSLSLRFSSWRTNFLLVGAILIFASVIWFLGISALREEIRVTYEANLAIGGEIKDECKTKSGPTLFKVIISTGLVFAVVGILFNGILKDGVPQWIPTYLTESFGISSSDASLTSIVFSIVNLSGAYVAAFVNKKMKNNEMKTSAVMFVLSTTALIVLKIAGKGSVVVAVLAIAVSLASMHGANIMLLSFIPLRFSRIGRSSSVTGFLNACSYISSAVSTVAMGAIADKSGGWSLIILSWSAVALMGAVTCFAGMGVWRRKCDMYNGKEENNE